MKPVPKISLIIIPIALISSLAFGFFKSPESIEPESPFSFSGNRLILRTPSKFLGHLEIIPIQKVAEDKTELRTVGQIIAMANPSGKLTGETVSWVELDDKLSRAVDLDVNSNKTDSVGTAYGLTSVSSEYVTRVQPGQQVNIERYALKGLGISGSIWKVKPSPKESDMLQVVFRFSQGQDWFPGTNCEITFPLLQSRAVQIPTTALVHEGIQEYVWKEVAPNEFTPQLINVVDSSQESSWVLGLEQSDRIVGEGAILLKPELQSLLKQREQGHASL